MSKVYGTATTRTPPVPTTAPPALKYLCRQYSVLPGIAGMYTVQDVEHAARVKLSEANRNGFVASHAPVVLTDTQPSARLVQ